MAEKETKTVIVKGDSCPLCDAKRAGHGGPFQPGNRSWIDHYNYVCDGNPRT